MQTHSIRNDIDVEFNVHHHSQMQSYFKGTSFMIKKNQLIFKRFKIL